MLLAVRVFSVLLIFPLLLMSASPLLGGGLRYGQDSPHHQLQGHDGGYGEVCVSPNAGASYKKFIQALEVTSDIHAPSSDNFQSSYTPPCREGVSLLSSFLIHTIATSSDL